MHALYRSTAQPHRVVHHFTIATPYSTHYSTYPRASCTFDATTISGFSLHVPASRSFLFLGRFVDKLLYSHCLQPCPLGYRRRLGSTEVEMSNTLVTLRFRDRVKRKTAGIFSGKLKNLPGPNTPASAGQSPAPIMQNTSSSTRNVDQNIENGLPRTMAAPNSDMHVILIDNLPQQALEHPPVSASSDPGKSPPESLTSITGTTAQRNLWS